MSTPETLRFALWPLPDLQSVEQGLLHPNDSGAEESLREVAYRNGVAEGRATLEAERNEQWNNAIQALDNARRELEESRRRLVAQGESMVHTLAVAVAREVVLREIETNPTVVADMVRKALDEISPGRPVSVRIHPEDLSVCRLESQMHESDWPRDIEWIQDPHMERGGCVVEGDRVVDGQLGVVLQELHRRLSHD